MELFLDFLYSWKYDENGTNIFKNDVSYLLHLPKENVLILNIQLWIVIIEDLCLIVDFE